MLRQLTRTHILRTFRRKFFCGRKTITRRNRSTLQTIDTNLVLTLFRALGIMQFKLNPQSMIQGVKVCLQMLPSRISTWSVRTEHEKYNFSPEERKACAEHNQKRDQANAKIDRQSRESIRKLRRSRELPLRESKSKELTRKEGETRKI